MLLWLLGRDGWEVAIWHRWPPIDEATNATQTIWVTVKHGGRSTRSAASKETSGQWLDRWLDIVFYRLRSQHAFRLITVSLSFTVLLVRKLY